MDFWKKWKNNVAQVRALSMKKRLPMWSIGIVFGVCLLVLGGIQEQFTDIYRKAIMICLECIGIG